MKEDYSNQCSRLSFRFFLSLRLSLHDFTSRPSSAYSLSPINSIGPDLIAPAPVVVPGKGSYWIAAARPGFPIASGSRGGHGTILLLISLLYCSSRDRQSIHVATVTSVRYRISLSLLIALSGYLVWKDMRRCLPWGVSMECGVRPSEAFQKLPITIGPW